MGEQRQRIGLLSSAALFNTRSNVDERMNASQCARERNDVDVFDWISLLIRWHQLIFAPNQWRARIRIRIHPFYICICVSYEWIIITNPLYTKTSGKNKRNGGAHSRIGRGLTDQYDKLFHLLYIWTWTHDIFHRLIGGRARCDKLRKTLIEIDCLSSIRKTWFDYCLFSR